MRLLPAAMPMPPSAAQETGSLSYSGAPASTSDPSKGDAPPEHGDGAAAPWVAAHRRGFTRIEVHEDLVYGRVGGSALLCDLAHPAILPSSPATPAIVGIHGGCWRGGHKRDTSTIVVTQWAQQFGFCALSVEYRLAGVAAPPACYQDVQCALRYVHANADALNIDRNRVFVIGQSAGGHLAALCATLGDRGYAKTGGWEEWPSTVAAAIPVAGPFELEPTDGKIFVQTEQRGTDYDTTYDAFPAPAWRLYWTPRETVQLHTGGPHGMTPVPAADATEARRLASPINHVSADKPPLLILASSTDVSAPYPNAERMAGRPLLLLLPPRLPFHYVFSLSSTRTSSRLSQPPRMISGRPFFSRWLSLGSTVCFHRIVNIETMHG